MDILTRAYNTRAWNDSSIHADTLLWCEKVLGAEDPYLNRAGVSVSPLA